MKTTLSLRKGLVKKARCNAWHVLPAILSVVKKQKMLLIGFFLSHIFLSSFAQETTVFFSGYDSCHIHAPQQFPFALRAVSVGSPVVRVAYVIPSNRAAQPNGVVYLQNAIKTGQQWYKEQMEQNGFGAKTFVFETDSDAVTPLIHVVHVNETDDFLRGDIWGRTIQAASNAGITVWASGELWVLIPEAHLMLPDGTVTGGAALGAGSGTGNSPGVAMLGSDALPFFLPELMTDDTPYDGKVLPDLGSFPMKQDMTAPWFEGNSFSSVASSRLGALFHEMGHAFGLAHDYRNDNNFHGNLMFNGLRGIRGSLFPEKYPQDYTRLEYASALILNVSHYFNKDKSVTSSPVVSYFIPPFNIPQQGHLRILFQASDDDSLSLAHLRYRGDVVAEMVLKGGNVDTTFAVPYFTQGDTNPYTLAVHDKQGNTSYSNLQINVQAGFNQSPIPFIRVDPPVPGVNQPIRLDASQSQDVDHPLSSVLAEWDVDNDGQFDTEPSSDMMVQYHYENPGNYLIRLKLTDPDGAQTISTPVSINIPGEKKIAVESFTLFNVDKDEDVADLKEGTVIDLTAWEGKKFSVRANTSPGMIDRVAFDLKGPITHQQEEKTLPYMLFGENSKGNIIGRKLQVGEYTLTATPFSASEQGIALTISFQVIPESNEPSIVRDKTLGGTHDDHLYAAILTQDGGYLLAGSSISPASGDKSDNSKGIDYWVVKTDDRGNKVWDKTFGRDYNDEPRSIISAHDGGYLVAGSSSYDDFGNEIDYWIIKIDEQGNSIWDKTYGGTGRDILRTAIAIPRGGYLLGGDSEANASGDKSENSRGASDYWIVKIDNQGNKVWDRTIGGAGDDLLYSIITTNDGGWLLGGLSTSDASGEKSENGKGSVDFWIVKIDSFGNIVWDKTIGGNGHDSFDSAVPTADGGYLLAGSSNSDISGDKSEAGKGDFDFWIVKTNAQGHVQWDKTIGGSSSESFTSAVLTPDGGYLLGGVSSSDASADKSENSKGNGDYWIVKTDASGNKVWDKTIGGSDADNLNSIVPLPDGDYLLAGSSMSNASGDKSENTKGGCNDVGKFCRFDYWLVQLKVPATPVTISFTLMNAYTDQEIKELHDGDTILLSEAGHRPLDIRANINAEKINKIAFELTGPIKQRRTEYLFPYALFGDVEGDFQGKRLLPGEYVLKATATINDTEKTSFTISFVVTDDMAINSFTLIDATLNKPLGTLSDGDVINLSSLKGHKLSMRADTQSKQLDKVVLTLKAGPIAYSRTEQYYPYTLFGDVTGKNGSTDYIGFPLLPGTYTLTATPYAGGVRGNSLAITFTVITGWEVPCLRVEVYPIPATDVINIKHEGNVEKAYMILMNANGYVLLHRPLSRQPVEQLDVSAFRKGVYYLKIVSPAGLQTIRLLVE